MTSVAQQVALRAPISGLLALVLAGCATQTMRPAAEDSSVGPAIVQPFRDLSLIREVAPPVLRQAAAEPYRTPVSCAALRAEVDDLDTYLGADVDQPQKKLGAEGLFGEIIGGALGLPFRGVVRKVTGSEAREKALRAAVLAGMVRRGYLKGSAASTCAPGKPSR